MLSKANRYGVDLIAQGSKHADHKNKLTPGETKLNKFKLLIKGFALLGIVSLLLSCGGGGGSGGTQPLATDGFTKTVELGAAVPWSAPFFTSAQHQQSLYLASDVKGSGYINSISLKLGADEVESICTGVTISMGHTTLGALTTTFAANVEQGAGSLETVLTGTVTIPAGLNGDYFTLILDQPFLYNGVDNLVVEFLVTSCSSAVELAAESGTANRALHDTSLGDLTGFLYPNTLHTNFNFAGGDNFIDSPTGVLSGTLYPFNINATIGRKVQLLYPAADISGSGPITGIGFPVGELTTDQTYTVNIKLGHSVLTELVSGAFADSYSDTPVTVATNLTFNVPAGVPVDEVVWLPVNGTFNYNGTDNLILEVETTDNSLASNYTAWRIRHSTGANNILTGDVGSATGTTVDRYYFTKFRFNGGTMDAGLGAINTSSQVFDNTIDGGEIQSLYLASELGTSKTINNISVRLQSNSYAASHSSYTLKMGHTAKNTLLIADSYTSNMDENATVFSGSFDIPDGLLAGDWVTIPLSTSFAYDSTKNLAVLFSTNGVDGDSNNVKWKRSVSQYPGRVVGAENSGNVNPGWDGDGILTIRFD